MPLGVLAQLPGIKDAAVAKLQSQAEGHLREVGDAVESCCEAAQQLRCMPGNVTGPKCIPGLLLYCIILAAPARDLQ